jgi:hypothetical protein
MPRVGFETTTADFQRVKSGYDLDRVATVVSHLFSLLSVNFCFCSPILSFFKFFYPLEWYFRDGDLLETVLEQGLSPF